MRLFLTLCTLTALAYAKPQAGYNYAAGNNGNFAAPSFQSNSFLAAPNAASTYGAPGGFSANNFVGSGPSNAALSNGHPNTGFSNGPTNAGFSKGPANGGGFTSGGFSSNNFGASSFQSSSNFQQQQTQNQQTIVEPPLVHKHFITVSGPEDNDNLEASKHLVIGRAQKNYRVVFIKAPSASSSNVKLSAEYAPQEEKTVIYVLTKKESALDIASDIATPAPVVPSKPEVFFIKYKTDEEAAHAQREIQAEYDKIEGTSEHIDGGVAQQKSVVGILGDAENTAASDISAASNDVSSTATQSVFSQTNSVSVGGSKGSGPGSSSNTFITSGNNGAKSPTYLPPSAKI